MDGGMSYAQVQAAVPESVNIVADPPRPFDLEAARELVAAIDRLPRPTLVTCRTGPDRRPRSTSTPGLQAGVSADEVLARVDADEAPFAGAEPLPLVRQGLEELPPDERS